MEKCLQRSPILKIRSFSFLLLTKETRCDSENRQKDSQLQQPATPLWITASNFETKSQAIEAAYEEHVRGEKNMGN